MLHVTVEFRCAETTLQILRAVAEDFTDAQAQFIVNALSRTLDSKGRGWLASLR